METHLKDGPARPLIPRGYRYVARLDRAKKGDGLLIGVKQHLLASPLDLSKYKIAAQAEMAGFELDGGH